MRSPGTAAGSRRWRRRRRRDETARGSSTAAASAASGVAGRDCFRAALASCEAFDDRRNVGRDDREIGERHRQRLIAPSAAAVRSPSHGGADAEADDDGDQAELVAGQRARPRSRGRRPRSPRPNRRRGRAEEASGRRPGGQPRLDRVAAGLADGLAVDVVVRARSACACTRRTAPRPASVRIPRARTAASCPSDMATFHAFARVRVTTSRPGGCQRARTTETGMNAERGVKTV